MTKGNKGVINSTHMQIMGTTLYKLPIIKFKRVRSDRGDFLARERAKIGKCVIIIKDKWSLCHNLLIARCMKAMSYSPSKIPDRLFETTSLFESISARIGRCDWDGLKNCLVDDILSERNLKLCMVYIKGENRNNFDIFRSALLSKISSFIRVCQMMIFTIQEHKKYLAGIKDDTLIITNK